MRHHAIIVTGDIERGYLGAAHAKARELFPSVSGIEPSGVNGYGSFLVPPDGSKEGWGESDVGDALRNEFTAFLRSMQWEDKSSPLAWVEVQYGDDNYKTRVVDDSHADLRNSRGI